MFYVFTVTVTLVLGSDFCLPSEGTPVLIYLHVIFEVSTVIACVQDSCSFLSPELLIVPVQDTELTIEKIRKDKLEILVSRQGVCKVCCTCARKAEN